MGYEYEFRKFPHSALSMLLHRIDLPATLLTHPLMCLKTKSEASWGARGFHLLDIFWLQTLKQS